MIKAYLFGALVALSSLAQAQVVKSVALKPGLVIASQSWDYGTIKKQYDNRLGLYAVGNVQFISKKYWGVSADIGYIRKGNREIFEPMFSDITPPPADPEAYQTREYNAYYDYITFSPIARGQLPLGNWTPYVLAGPRVDYLLGYGWDRGGDIHDGDLYLNKTSVGITFGLGAEYKWNNKWGVLLEGQKFYDFNPLYRRAAGPSNTSLDVRNQVFVMNTGLRLYFNQ